MNDSRYQRVYKDVEKKAWQIYIDPFFKMSHVEREHLNASEDYLQFRLMYSPICLNKPKQMASSILVENKSIFYNYVKRLITSKKVIKEIVDYLLWDEDELDSETEGYQLARPIPKNMSGVVIVNTAYLEEYRFAFVKYNAKAFVLIVRRNPKYIEDIKRKGWSREDPFTLPTAYSDIQL